MTVELLHSPDCPRAGATIQMVRRCLAELGRPVTLIERCGDYPSPTVRVNGQDVMGTLASLAPSCRLDVPTERQFLAAIEHIARGNMQ